MSKSLKILWVKSGPLYPLDSGGKKRTHAMLCELSKQHDVTYLALLEKDLALAPEEPDAGYASTKRWLPWEEAATGSPRFFAELFGNLVFSTLPYAVAKYRSKPMEDEIVRLCRDEKFDLVICDFLFPAANFLHIGKSLGTPTVLFQHNVEAQIWKRLAAGKSNPIARWYFGSQFRRMAKWEQRLSELFDGVIMVSPEDSAIARGEYGLSNVLGDVPTGVDPDYFQPGEVKNSDGATTIGFLGSMDWMPNIEAVQWFEKEVFSKVKAKTPGTKLLVIGRRPPASITEMAEKDTQIEVTGTVDDVRPYLKRCDFLIVPLLSGGGTRIKIMEALAAGLPVVSTTIGAEGLGLVDGEHISIADSADDFAEAVSKMAADAGMRERLSKNGSSLARAEYGWARATDIFMGHCEKVLAGKKKEGISSDFFPRSMPEGRTPVYFFTRNYYPTLTGATERFRRYLPGLSKKGVDFYVITSQNDPSLPEIEHTGLESIRRVPVKGAGYADMNELLLPMLEELENAAPGTIQVFGFDSGLRGQLKRLQKVGHRVLLVRTMMPSFQPPLLSLSGIRRLLRIHLDSASVNRISAGTTVMRDAFSLGSEGLRKKYAIIPHGINVERFTPLNDVVKKAELRRKLGLAEDAFIVLSVGSVMERKRTHLTVEAFQELNAIEPNSQLVVIGENKTRDTLSAEGSRNSFVRYCDRVNESAAKCAPGSVIFTGEVGNVEAYYQVADLFVFTSEVEGMPNAVIEAMASGLPCVLTPFSGLPETEFGTPGQEFILCDAESSAISDEILGIISDRKKGSEIGNAARDFARSNLNSESAINAYAKIYQNIT